MTHPDHPRRRVSAFTLIELLTVIAIIGILAAIIIPTVSKVRQTARNTQCVSQLREWARVIQLYANDNKGNYYVRPWASDAENEAPGGFAYKAYFTKSRFELYRMRYCPSDPETAALLADNARSDPRYCIVQGSINGILTSHAPEARVPLGRARTPSQYMLMVDSVRNATAILNSTNLADMISPSAAGTLILPTDPNRHGNKFNAVFGDGSVKRIGWSTTNLADRTNLFVMKSTWLQLN